MTCYTALITPFDASGALDEEGLVANLAHQKSGGVDGVVALGTTGETPTLSADEKKRVIQLCKGTGLPLMVGCGANSTTQALENIKWAADLGATSVLVVTPYYNKPTQEGLYQHFAHLATHSPLDIVIYNIHGRTAVNLETETLKRLASFPKLVGVKEASGDVAQISEVIALNRYKVYAGDDVMTLPLMAMGGDGVIGVASNLVPHLMKRLVTEKSVELHHKLLPLFRMQGIETNPIPIKAAMQLAGFAAGAPRLPLTPLSKRFLPILHSIVEELT